MCETHRDAPAHPPLQETTNQEDGRYHFRGRVNLLGTAPREELELHAITPDEEAVLLARLDAHRTVLAPQVSVRFRPLLVNGLDKSETSWLMHILHLHPDVVVAGGHPFEVQAAQYWAHVARMLGQPFPAAWTLRQRGGWEGCDPRYQPVDRVSALQDWLSHEYVG